MTVIERKAHAVVGENEYVVRPLRDREEIRRHLETRRAYAAYALGQLDPLMFPQSEWWTARAEGARRALVLHSRGGLGSATFAMGDSGALDAVLQLHPGPRHAFLTCEVAHLPVVLKYFELEQRQTMIRMRVTPEMFAPVHSPVERLTGADSREINRLYRTDGVPSNYTSHQIDDSVYFGARMDGTLVSIAGTHVISSMSAIAVVGNVYTHPRYRGMHLAEATTSAVTELLLRTCREVVLSVDPTNTPAVRAYERLGYREVERLIEGAALRRDSLGLVSAARRAVARFRGRGRKAEVVRIDAD
ncbi:MAG TPA: GNAT family N-acetyltransferase [Dehalococcoidia bacterium]|nr:GNAT family N-acetyltransferase [Dehalococcoidia bacterium]